MVEYHGNILDTIAITELLDGWWGAVYTSDSSGFHSGYVYAIWDTNDGGTTINDTLQTIPFSWSAAGYVSSAGTGIITAKLFCLSTNDSSAVEGASINWRELSTDALKGEGSTDVTGLFRYDLSTGNHYARAHANNYTFTSPACTTLIPAADSVTDTIWASPLSPTLTDSVGMTTVYGVVYAQGGRAANVLLEFTQDNWLGAGSNIYLAYQRTVPTNDTGYFETYLFPDTLISSAGDSSFTKLRVLDQGVELFRMDKLRIPDTSSIALPSVSGWGD